MVSISCDDNWYTTSASRVKHTHIHTHTYIYNAGNCIAIGFTIEYIEDDFNTEIYCKLFHHRNAQNTRKGNCQFKYY